MGDIFIDPTDGCRSFVVVADVAHKLAREILYGIEDTSRNYVALNFGKPNFDLVKPAGVGRGVVDRTVGLASRNSETRLVLCALKLSATTWISRPGGWLVTICARKSTNSALVWRALVLASTSPVWVFRAP
jgi:hypothetical protein